MLFLQLTLLVITMSHIRAVSIYKHQHYYKNHNGHPDDNGNCPDPKLSYCRAGFSYNRKICPGPAGWSSISTCFHACNNGHRQSPINIDSDRAYYVSWLPPLRFESQFEAEETEVSNHRNHAPEFESDDEEEIYLKLNQLKEGRYKFRNLHVHNGRRRRRGSEHSVNGRFTPMEAHVVFYEDDVTSPSERSSRVRIGGRHGYSDAFVVIGVFLEVDDDDFGDEPDDDECKDILSGDQDYGQRKKRRDGNTNHEQGKGGRNSHFWNSFENDDDGDDDNDDDSSSSNESYETDDINNYNASGWRWWNYLGVRKGGNTNWFGRGRCRVRKARRLSRILECAYRNKKVREFKHLGHQEELEVDIRPEDVLPSPGHRQYYTYEGSLTTPPCNETVH